MGMRRSGIHWLLGLGVALLLLWCPSERSHRPRGRARAQRKPIDSRLNRTSS